MLYGHANIFTVYSFFIFYLKSSILYNTLRFSFSLSWQSTSFGAGRFLPDGCAGVGQEGLWDSKGARTWLLMDTAFLWLAQVPSLGWHCSLLAQGVQGKPDACSARVQRCLPKANSAVCELPSPRSDQEVRGEGIQRLVSASCSPFVSTFVQYGM